MDTQTILPATAAAEATAMFVFFSDPWHPGVLVGWDVARDKEARAVFRACGVRPHRPEQRRNQATGADQFVARLSRDVALALRQAAEG